MPPHKREREESDVEEGSRKKPRTTTASTSTSTSTSTSAPTSPLEHNTRGRIDFMTDHIDDGQTAPHEHTSPALQLLRGDFDDLRQLITCKICERLLYEPYVLSCGHTYCYSCLSTWFTTSNKKTCPMCRDNVTQPPVPSHLIREMTVVFMRRHDLLPDGETVEQHNQWREEEAQIIRKDRDDGGLFKNIFNRPDRIVPIRDPVDGVDRCPRCNWEVEDGMCNNCGIHMDGYSDDSGDSESDDDDLDADLDELDADLRDDLDPSFGQFAHYPGPHGADGLDSFDDSDDGHQLAAEIRRRYEILGPRFLNQMTTGFPGFGESGDEEDEGDDDEGSLEDFIDDRDDVDITAHTISSQTDQGRPPRWRRPTTVVSSPEDSEDSDGDDDGDDVDAGSNVTSAAPPVYEINNDSDEQNDDDYDSDVPRVLGSRSRQSAVPRRGARRQVILDSDEDSPNSSAEAEAVPAPGQRRATGHARSLGIDEDSDETSSGSDVGEESREDMDSQSEDEMDDSGEVGYERHGETDEDDEGSVINNGFSPMQSSDGGPELSFHQFDVYGGLDEDDEDDEGDWD